MKNQKIGFGLLLSLIFLMMPLWAQGGTIRGNVVTSAKPGAFGPTPVAGAEVVLIENGTRTSTASDGSFTFFNLPAKRYTIQVMQANYGVSTKSVVVEDGQTVQTNITLLPGGGIMVDQGIVPPDTIYVAFGSLLAGGGNPRGMVTANQMGQNITQMSYMSAISAGADPFRLGVNPPVPIGQMAKEPNDYQFNTTSEPNNLMIFNPQEPGKPNFMTLNKKPLRMGFNVSGTLLYLTTEDNCLQIYDTVNNNILVGNMIIPGIITDLQPGYKGGKLYLAVSGGSPGVMIMDTVNNRIIDLIPAPNLTSGGVGQPRAVAISRGESKVYIALASATGGDVAMIDLPSKSISGIVPVGMMPVDLLLSPDGSKLFVANYNGGEVVILDPLDLTAKARIRVGVQPTSLALSKDGAFLYVVNNGSNNISVINTSSYQVVASIATGNSPLYCAITSDGSRLIVGNNGDGTINVIDTKKNIIIYTSQPMPNSQPFSVIVKP